MTNTVSAGALLLALCTLSGCTEVRSLAPALDAAHTIDVEAILSRWEIRDTAVLEICNEVLYK